MIMMSAHPRYLCRVIVEICQFHSFNIKGLPPLQLAICPLQIQGEVFDTGVPFQVWQLGVE
jgi:hypothetical protein